MTAILCYLLCHSLSSGGWKLVRKHTGKRKTLLGTHTTGKLLIIVEAEPKIVSSQGIADNGRQLGEEAVKEAYSGKYQMMIAHPPCTYMSRAGARWMYPTAGNLCQDRYAKAMEAKALFLELMNAPIEYIAIENPTPLKVVGLPKQSQAIQPYDIYTRI